MERFQAYFSPTGKYRSILSKGKKFQFLPLLAAILDFSGKWKSVNILKTVRDRAISSEFLTSRIVQEYSMQRGKISSFALLAAILDFSGKWKSVNILKTVRDSKSDFKWIFDQQDSTRVFYAKGKNFNFCHFWRPSWILAENEKCEYLGNGKR